MSFNVAIDGPAGAGKSTIARRVAAETGLIYVDTGAMYRALALYFLRCGIEGHEKERIEQALDDVNVSIRYADGVQQVILNGENVSGLIRTEAVGNMASAVSVYPAVREKLLDLQRDLAAAHDVIMDGRDIGTHILPDADVKVYLTASSRERARRRYIELREKGIDCDIDAIERDIDARDARDKNREAAPLRQAPDAVYLDTSDMDIDAVTGKIKDLIKKRMARRERGKDESRTC